MFLHILDVMYMYLITDKQNSAKNWVYIKLIW